MWRRSLPRFAQRSTGCWTMKSFVWMTAARMGPSPKSRVFKPPPRICACCGTCVIMARVPRSGAG